MPRPIDPAREGARALGAKRYASLHPCPYGHRDRWTISTNCATCSLEKQKAKNEAAGKKVRTLEPKTKVQPPKPQHPRPRSLSIKTPVRAAMVAYLHTVEARERSDRLDDLIRRNVRFPRS